MKAHDNLEEFDDPPNYDMEEGERSAPRIAFYCDLAKTIGGPALEIACVSGLVTLPVAAQGLDVTGVDLSRPMLEHARKKAEAQDLNIRWVEADARSFDLGTHYQFIFMTGNAFQAFLRREDQEALFASVRHHLLPNGVFVFETRNPSGHDLTDQSEEEFDQSYMSVEGHEVSVSSTQVYDPIAQIIFWPRIAAGTMENAITQRKPISPAALHIRRNWKRSCITTAFKFSTNLEAGIGMCFLLRAQASSRFVNRGNNGASSHLIFSNTAIQFGAKIVDNWLMAIIALHGKPCRTQNVS